MPNSWTNVELTALLEDEDSCVYLERVQKHLGLHPFHLTDLNAALRDMLNANLNFFDTELNGLVLAYRNTKLLSPLGYIMYDTCFVHIDIEADFYIFRPEVGRSLKGFVNKKSTNHIGILVHKVFNVSVPKPNNEEGEEMENEITWPGDKVSIGQEVRFTLKKLDYTTRIPYIRGILHEDEYLSGCHLFNEQIAATCESEFQKVARWSINGEDQDDKRKVKLKTENKRITFNSDSEVEIDRDSGPEKKKSIKKLLTNSDALEQPQKKLKKRKRKSALDSESDTELTEQSDQEKKTRIKKKLLLNNSDSHEFLVPTDTVKKRKKHSIECNKSPIKQKTLDISNGVETAEFNGKVKNDKKKSKKHKFDTDTEDEKEQKSLIKNLETESYQVNSVSKENALSSPKRIKKLKNMNGISDTEDEKQYKLTINKNIVANDVNLVDTKSESDIEKRRKKRKRSLDDKHVTEDNKDNKNNKLLLNNGFEVPQSLPKKRKRKHSEVADDSEAERKYKKALISNILESVESIESKNSEFQVSTVLSKKEKKHAVKNDVLMDTEDERTYKSSLKPLVESLQTDNQENDISHKKHKKKKDKNKHKSSNELETESEFNSLLVKVKDEPESEIEGKAKFKREKQSVERTNSVKNIIDSSLEEEFNKSLKKKRKKLGKERKSISESEDKFKAEDSPIKIETFKTEKSKILEEQNKLGSNIQSNENSQFEKKKNLTTALLRETVVTDIKTEEEHEEKKLLSKQKRNKESSK